MSKIDFKKIVQTVLLEVTWLDQGQSDKTNQIQNKLKTQDNYPRWFKNILDKHEKLGLGKINDNDVRAIYNIGAKHYVSREDARKVKKYIRILDVIKTLYDRAAKKPDSLTSFFASKQIDQIGQNLEQTIQQYKNKNEWPLQNPQVSNAYEAIKTTPTGVISRVAGALGALRTGMSPVG